MNLHLYDRAHAQVMEPWMRETSLVKALADTTADISRHRCDESKRAGHDIGWDRAVVDWTMRFGHGLREGARR